MQVKEIMTTDVVTAHPDTPYKALLERLLDCQVSGVPVVDDEGALVGIVTEADLLARTAFDGERPRALAIVADAVSGRQHHWVTKALAWTASDVMTRSVVTCSPQTDVRAAARELLDHDLTRLPVVRDGRVVGILSRRDVLRTLVRADADIAADVDRVLTADPNRPDDHHVVASVIDGKVTLTGDVRYAWDAPVIVAMVRRVDGVIGVENHLHHREPAPRMTTPSSPWLTPRR
jgi:CBS domain-containing protein